MKSTLLLFGLALLFSCQQKAVSLKEDSDLAIGSLHKGSLKKHQADTFRLNLEPGALVYGEADQLSVDVIVEVYGPDKKRIAEFDSPARGPEPYQFTSTAGGIYRLVVVPFQENTGEYTLRVRGAEPLAADNEDRIDQIVKSMIGEGETPGVSVAVAREGEIIYSRGFGYADLEHDIKNTPQTVFHIASVSKQFTAFAIAMLADQGKLSLQDDIRRHLPELKDFGHTITIDHLVHHTSGLRDQWNLLALAGWRLDDVITKHQIMRLVSRQKELNFKPGDEMLYCNTGFTLMAEIVERVTKETFAAWTKKNIFDPLGMKNTLFYDDHERIVKNRAYSYHMGSDGFKKSVLSYANAGATSLFTTVEDLSLWAMNFDNVRVGNGKVMQMMERRFVLNNGDTTRYAFGQVLGRYKGLPIASHGGADAGYRTMLLRFPEQRFSVSVFSNLASFNPGGLAFRVADLYLGDTLTEEPAAENAPQEPPAPAFDPSTLALSDFPGRYTSDELETSYDFAVVNDTLIARHQRHDDIRFTPTDRDRFSSNAWFMGNIEFIRDKRNRVTGLKVNSGRVRNLLFARY